MKRSKEENPNKPKRADKANFTNRICSATLTKETQTNPIPITDGMPLCPTWHHCNWILQRARKAQAHSSAVTVAHAEHHHLPTEKP